jgi:Phage P22-like portal protein
MGRKSKAQRNAEIHALALQQFDDSYIATEKSRQDAAMARRFVNVRGAQWEWDILGQFENRMRLEIDHVSGAITRIKNEFRKNRVQAKFIPADGTDADTMADACASRFRADTYDTQGRAARKMAFDCAVEGGLGGMRLRAEYEKGSKEHQRICLEPINDPESCLYFDANAKTEDKSDAEHAFLITPWTRRAFIAKYGEDLASWPQELIGQYRYPWFGQELDVVYVCEYFVKEDRTDKYRIFELDGPGDDVEEYLEDEVDEDEIAALTARGFVEIEGREERVDQVRKYILNGAKILEDGVIIPGRCIPLVPQYGHRTVINNVEVFRGHVLKSIDPQIVYNLEVSTVGETAAASGIETPIFLDEQINPYITEWQDAHITRPAFMRIAKAMDGNGNVIAGGPIGFTKSPEIAPAVAALVSLTKQDISDQLGNPEQGEQVMPDMSGVAMDLAQGRIDMQSYGYIDNAADAERRIAEIWQSMAAEIYVEDGRKLKTMSEDGARGSVEIGKKKLDKKTGKMVPEVDFTRVPYDVEVDVGPTSSSRRQAVVRTITPLIGAVADPQTNLVLTHVALQNIEGEGMSAVREWSRSKLVEMGVEKPTPEEEQEMEAAMAAAGEALPDPQAMLAEAMSMEAKAKAMQAEANTALALARTKETEAKTAETLASIPIAQQKQALETAKAIAETSTPDQPQQEPPLVGQ